MTQQNAFDLLAAAGFQVVKQVSQNKWNVTIKLGGLAFTRACYLAEVIQLAQSLRFRPEVS